MTKIRTTMKTRTLQQLVISSLLVLLSTGTAYSEGELDGKSWVNVGKEKQGDRFQQIYVRAYAEGYYTALRVTRAHAADKSGVLPEAMDNSLEIAEAYVPPEDTVGPIKIRDAVTKFYSVPTNLKYPVWFAIAIVSLEERGLPKKFVEDFKNAFPE